MKIQHKETALKKDLSIEGLRGFAALLVVLNHLPFASMGIGFKWIGQFGLSKFALMCAGNSGSFGVELFFCITGYLFWKKVAISGRVTDWSRFYVNRVCRLVPAYFLFAAIVLISVGFITGWERKILTSELLHQIFALFTFGFDGQQTINGVDTTYFTATIWTLAYEWQFYILLPLLVAFRGNRFLLWSGIVALIAFVFAYNNAYYRLLFFFTGAAIAESSRARSKQSTLGTVVFLALAALYIALPHRQMVLWLWKLTDSAAIGNISGALLSWIVTSATFASVIYLNPKVLFSRVMVGLGTISYSLYLLHLLVLQGTIRFGNAVSPVGTWGPKRFALWAVLATAASIAIAVCSYYGVEKPFLARKRPEREGGALQEHPAHAGINRS
ncbi:acyltransferase [Caballeronia sp. INDeC2]|uniref:acyltransferase family protein n=1 Tax=Caballeronia sp. INDeC2 TaxID=2921747 RepID=UPI002027BD1B|nr:acyltransferase [Caballeronia sp. INDeC2]